MPEPRHQLDAIQRWMQSVITHPGGVIAGTESKEARGAIDLPAEEIDTLVNRSRALTSVERLEIYNRAYFARLLDCLREEYSVLAAALGEDLFNSFALAYLHEHPSQSYTLADLGSRFPEFLAATRPDNVGRIPDPSEHSAATDTDRNDVAISDGFGIRPTDRLHGSDADWPEFLIDLARLERAVNVVFDGPGVEGQPLLSHEQLAAIPPERWPQARFVCVPCLKLLALSYPVNDYFAAIRRGQQPEIPERAPSHIALTRRDYRVFRRPLDPIEYALLEALRDGETVVAAIARAASSSILSDDELCARLRDWFCRWSTEGYLQSVIA